MLLKPLAVLFLGQIFIILLTVILYQRQQKKRLLAELDQLRPAKAATPISSLGADFNRPVVTNLLNSLAASIPAVSNRQEQLFNSLANELSLEMQVENTLAKDEFNLGINTDELVSQADLDAAVYGDEPLDKLDDVLSLDAADDEENALEEFDLDAIDDLDTSDEPLEDEELDFEIEGLELGLDDDDVDLDLDLDLDFNLDDDDEAELLEDDSLPEEIGRASCRERV